MMGQEGIGEIAALNDKILKHIIDGNNVNGVFEILSESNKFMTESMAGSKANFEELKQKIGTNYANILD